MGIILPGSKFGAETKPLNDYALHMFLNQIQEEKIRQVVILGWSGDYDDHVRPFLEKLSAANLSIFHVDLAPKDPTALATYQWGVLEETPLLLEEGGKSILYGLAKAIGLKEPCISYPNPIQQFFSNWQSFSKETQTISLQR